VAKAREADRQSMMMNAVKFLLLLSHFRPHKKSHRKSPLETNCLNEFLFFAIHLTHFIVNYLPICLNDLCQRVRAMMIVGWRQTMGWKM
jgi:hypothetical protein